MKQHSKLIKPNLKLTNNAIYHNLNKFFSYKELFIAMIDGGRGVGKTTGALLKGLLNVDKGEEFIYLRRYKPEIKEFVSKNSIEPILDNVIYKGDGAGGYTAYFDDIKLGYLLPLSISRLYKSTNFSKVTLIIFDEAMVMKGGTYRYLKDEVVVFLEFLSTVIRTRTNVRVVMLANNEDLFSPYNVYFEIPSFERIYIDYQRGIYCEHVLNSPELIKKEQETGLFKLTQNTAYGDYHYKNKNIAQKKIKVMENKPVGATVMFRLNIEGCTLTIYKYYTETKRELRLYCQYVDKIINDKTSYDIVEKGVYNKFNIDLYKKRLKNFLHRFYFGEIIDYNHEKAHAILTWVIQSI